MTTEHIIILAAANLALSAFWYWRGYVQGHHAGYWHGRSEELKNSIETLNTLTEQFNRKISERV